MTGNRPTGTTGTSFDPMTPEEALNEEPFGKTRTNGSLWGDVHALIEDGQTLIEAELAYQQARAAYAWKRGKGIAVLLVLTLFFAFFALMAVVVGLLLALTPLLSAWGALAVVALGLTALAALSMKLAISRFRNARARLLAKEPQP